ncbi:unnamed protein product [Prunus armeniaca]|uniref:TNase-like domain-containing protein n=1 Tax=Prunus armeniaca TaxID=36596 RepID=A0A6J5XZ08_PRUAR|nr:unnamed protein product [Prunus armeniaca]CAB4318431.1 unnamed protein product [Prunus armeniaca]
MMELKNADYEANEGRSRVREDYVPRPRALERIPHQNFIGTVVEIVSGDHIIIVADDSFKDSSEHEYEVLLSSISCPKSDGSGVEREVYAYEAKEFVRALLIGRQVHVELEYSRKHDIENIKTYHHGSVFLVTALDGQNVSELVVAEGLATVLKRDDVEVVSNYYDALCNAESSAILNKKGMHSGVDPLVMDIKDVSDATWQEAGNASNHIFLYLYDKYNKVPAVVESVIHTTNKNKIILFIQQYGETWRIAFSLDGVIWPRDEEPYAAEAFRLLRRTILQRRVEVELSTNHPIDYDGYFVGTLLLESNTHAAIPLLQAGLAKLAKKKGEYPKGAYRDELDKAPKLAKMEGEYPKGAYHDELNKAQKSARTKKLKMWENYVEPSYQCTGAMEGDN